jgi:hypothetical protein
MTTRVGNKSKYEFQGCRTKAFRAVTSAYTTRCKWGELLVVVKVIGVQVLYYEERFKRWVRQMQGLGI